ncbi:MAG: DUF6870 family protein [Oscillospiraceae bacterium]
MLILHRLTAALWLIFVISILTVLCQQQKMQSYLEQIVNPYCFLCGDTPVRIRFVAEDRTLKQSLCDYFLSLK